MDDRQNLDEELHDLAVRTQDRRIRTIRLLLAGRGLEVDEDRERVARYIAHQANLDLDIAKAIAAGASIERLGLSPEQRATVKMLTGKDGSVPHPFVDDARQASRAVGRLVAAGGETGLGTCFMISPRLLATAGHNVETEAEAKEAEVEFKFLAFGTQARIETRFALDPGAFFLSRGDLGGLDCAIIALGKRLSGDFTPTKAPLGDKKGEFPPGFYANLVHYPEEILELVMRENQVLYPEGNDTLVYKAETEPGSSGSPVFNDLWEVVAVHRGSRTEGLLNVGCDECEVLVKDVVALGVRAGSIIKKLREIYGTLSLAKQMLLDEALPK